VFEALGSGDKANSQACQFLNPGHAMHQRPPETVELPNHDHVKTPVASIGDQLIESWPRCLRATHLVLLDLDQFPPAALDVLLQFADLNGVGLVARGDSGIDRG
jgi:hypothetical protein